jgi:hypothetical protein
MKLTVVLARYPPDTPQAGYLAAYIVQEGARRGRNLLAGIRATGVPYAQTMVQRELNCLIPGTEITFEGPEGEVSNGNGRGGGK